jgi:hypothetical protein
MPWQFIKYVRRPFQALFFSMDHHLNEARVLDRKIHAQDFSDPTKLDQDLWMREKAASRASFIMGIAGIEAFSNNLLGDFAVRRKSDLSEALLNRSQKANPVERWRLTDKVYFLPTLCNRDLAPPASYFKRDSGQFQLFEELVQIRNAVMHGRPTPFLALVKLRPDKKHEANDDIAENFWPLSRVPKDFSSFNYECAKTACENITWVRDSLAGFLDKADDKYLKEEKIELVSTVIPDAAGEQRDLLSNWRDHVRSSALSDFI